MRGTGHTQKQWNLRYNHGGVLRNIRKGRRFRPLSTREPIHLVLKAQRSVQRRGGFRSPQEFLIVQKVIRQYAKRFFVKVEQVAVAGDHIHMLIRLSKRALGQHFFRVVAGQIAQRFEQADLLVTGTPGKTKKKEKLWRYRPFTRVVRGWRAYLIVRDYVQLNKKEAEGQIPYRKTRLKGLSSAEWRLLRR